MQRSGQIVETRVRVRYAETDQMGVVYYSNYLVWMELGRVDWCRAVGVRYRDMEIDDGILLVVSEANCQYRHPARYDDEIIVKTWLAEANSRGLKVDYDMHEAASGARVAKGYTKHVFCGRDVRPCRLPEKYWEVFGIASSDSRSGGHA